MLQYVTNRSDRFSIAEQARMAIEGGCRWIQLSIPGASDGEIERVAAEITPICRETGTILVIEGHVEAVMNTRVHGVLLRSDDRPADEVREYLGPHAIIGCAVSAADEIMALAPLDVDYFSLGCGMTADDYRTVIDRLRAGGVEQPVVARGGITAEMIPQLLAAGVNGVAISRAILDASDPEEATEAIIRIASGK
ncbi:MAG: thiamine phosphate synthase [Muribaculaceae bacterium]|nr:thiamine phosphate synthase [Muribaculaceae bacterium]